MTTTTSRLTEADRATLAEAREMAANFDIKEGADTIIALAMALGRARSLLGGLVGIIDRMEGEQ